VLTIHNSLNPAIKKLLVRLDVLLSMASCLIIPAIVGGSLVMFVEQAPEQKFISNGYMWESAGSWISISIPVTVQTKTNKALYRIFIKDKAGEVIYVYPDHFVKDPSEFKLIDDHIQLPDLKPGEYQIGAKLIYWFNPIKNGTVDFELSNVVIK